TRRLDRFFTKLVGSGQPYFNIGNEPSFVSPYAYTWAGAPWRTQAIVRRIMTEIYKPTPGGLPGNDDLGATSAWYVWGALGIYPAIPGVGGFVITSPLFPAATIRLGDGRRLRITTENATTSSVGTTENATAQDATAHSIYVRGMKLDGATYTRAWLPLAPLRASSKSARTDSPTSSSKSPPTHTWLPAFTSSPSNLKRLRATPRAESNCPILRWS